MATLYKPGASMGTGIVFWTLLVLILLTVLGLPQRFLF